MSQRSLISIGTFVIIFIFIGKFLAFGKDIAISAYFGAGMETDAFFIASNITSILFVAFYTTVSIVFLPLYNEKINNQNKNNTKHFSNTIITFYLLISILISVFSFYFSADLVNLISSNDDENSIILTTNLLKVMIISFVFSIFISFLNSIHLSHSQYIYPHLVPIINNTLVLLALIFFASNYGIYVPVVIGVIAWVIQIPIHLFLSRNYFRFSLNFKFKEQNLKRIGSLFIPAFLGVLIDQMNILVDTVLASGLANGSVSALNYSNRLISFSSGIFIMGIMSIMFPIFSKYFEKGLTSQLNESIRISFRILLLALTLTTIIIFIYYYEIISIVYGRGNFDETAVQKTSSVFLFYSVGLIFLGLRELFNKVFYAHKDTKSPLYISMVAVTSNIVMSITLVKTMGIDGLALSTSLSLAFYVTMQITILRKTIGTDFLRGTYLLLFKLIIASIISITSMLLLKNYAAFQNIIVQLFSGVVIATITYTTSLYLLKTEELLFFTNRVQKKP